MFYDSIMKKVYLFSGLSLSVVLAYFLFLRKKTKENVELQKSAIQKADFSERLETQEVKDTKTEEAQFYLDQYEEYDKLYQKEISKVENNPIYKRNPNSPLASWRKKRANSIKRDRDEVERKINSLGFRKVGGTFIKDSNILTT